MLHSPRSERVAIATHVFLPVGHVRPLQLDIDERRVQEAVQRLPYRLDTVQHVIALSGLGDRGQPYRLVELIADYGLIRGLGPRWRWAIDMDDERVIEVRRNEKTELTRQCS